MEERPLWAASLLGCQLPKEGFQLRGGPISTHVNIQILFLVLFFPLNPLYPSPFFKRPLLLLVWVCNQKPVYSGFSFAWSEGPNMCTRAGVSSSGLGCPLPGSEGKKPHFSSHGSSISWCFPYPISVAGFEPPGLRQGFSNLLRLSWNPGRPRRSIILPQLLEWL